MDFGEVKFTHIIVGAGSEGVFGQQIICEGLKPCPSFKRLVIGMEAFLAEIASWLL